MGYIMEKEQAYKDTAKKLRERMDLRQPKQPHNW